MATSFLYDRITERRPQTTGTLAEPNGAPEPRFALQGTVNWMRALHLIVKDEGIAWSSMQTFYSNVQRLAALTPQAANTIFEQLLMSLNHLSALHAMANAGSHRDLARVSVMTWYYGIYCAASAMIAAKDGSQQQDHAGTATQWDRQIAAQGLATKPFHYRITTLVKKDADAELTTLRNANTSTINSRPATVADAHGACVSYLSGTRGYREWQISEDVKTKELAKLGLSDFRTAEAKKLRDSRLQSKSLGFIHQAFRYRGKANYRDALFLTYEAQVGTVLDGFIEGMEAVLQAFVSMAGAFCARRVNPSEWQAFIIDLNAHLRLAVMPSAVWS